MTSRGLEASQMRSLMYLVNYCTPLPFINEKIEKACDHHPFMKNMCHSELFIVYKLHIPGDILRLFILINGLMDPTVKLPIGI